MPEYRDQLNRTITLDRAPVRILSLVPSQTELLFDLGLKNEVAGITSFCIRPEAWYNSKTRVGGTKKLDLHKIRNLQPDLVIGNKEENDRSQIEELMTSYPVWMSDVKTLPDALDMIHGIGNLCARSSQADEITRQITNRFKDLPTPKTERKAAYFIWRKPWMAAGQGTFINEMMKYCGLTNCFMDSRYPEISFEILRKANPQTIILSSEPYPFKEKHLLEFQEVCPKSEIMLVDGEFFSWYGSRLLNAPEYFREHIFK